MKKQFITRVFLSSLVLALTSLFGGGNLLAQEAQETVVFYESFDKCAGTGGNDGVWSGITNSATLTTTNEGWTFENANGASKCARFGSKSTRGSATTPKLNFEGAATLTFKAGAWNYKSEQTTLNISIEGGSFVVGESSLSSTSVKMKKGDWTTYTISITGASADTKIKFEGYTTNYSRFFLDEVKITQASSGDPGDPGDTKNDPELAYNPSEYDATIGQTEGFPTLSNPHDVTGITYSSSDETVATVDEKSGKVTLTGEGKTTITASFPGNDDWKADDASYTLNVSKPSANLAYSASSCTVIVGETPELPTLSCADGVTGIVYASTNTEVATVNETTGEVTLTGAEGTTVISATLTGHATFADGSASYTLTVTDKLLAQETVDHLTASLFTATSSTYESFSGKTATSSAVYAGNSANDAGAIQLRSKNSNSGIVTTTSGGKVTKIVLEWKAKSENAGKTIDVYGKKSVYSSAADLYKTSDQGDKIGSIKYGESTLEVTGDYEFIGLRSNNGALYLNSVEITWASSGGSGGSEETTKKDPNLAYSASSCTVIVGETPELPTFSCADGVTGIVYASTNTNVATVDKTTGEVTLTDSVGTTTITASLTGDATYADGSASYELTVKKPNLFVYKKITSVEGLIKGATYVFVCEGTNKVGTAVSDKKMQPTNATLTDGILEESVDEPMEFVLDIKDGKYCFISGGKYLKGADGTDLTMVFYSTTDEAIKWNILFDEVKGALIWNTYGANNGTGRRLMYRSSKDYNVFGHYAGTIGTEYYNVQLYQKVYPLTVSSATSGYATFYNEEEAYQMPAGLTGYAVTKAENGHYITRKTAYEARATVPAKTPLLIIGQANSYYPAVVSGTGVEAYAGSNLLEGARDANGKTHSAKDVNVYYYKLGLNTKYEPGFYWGAEGGAAFKMTKATTAYLAVPQKLVEGANALFFDFGPETGINEIQTEQADKAIFDLSGRRVQKATKGFYIVGGKKVLVK